MSRLWPIGLLVVAADQGTKWWIGHALAVGETRMVLPTLLYFTHVYNPGAAFGLFPSQQWLFIGAAFAVLAYAWAERERIAQQPLLLRFGVVLGLAGAIGNVIDRILRGAVLDFIDIIIIPVFNVADMAITVGVVCIMWTLIVHRPDTGEDASVERRKREGDGTWKN